MSFEKIHKQLIKKADKKQAQILQKFFKTGKGEYGEGDIFLGVKVPETRKIVYENKDTSIQDIQKLLNSKIHGERFAGILLIVYNYEKSVKEKNLVEQKKFFDFYLSNSTKINNWDLVDVSAPKIVGHYLLTHPRKILYSLAKSTDLWEKRIAIISTLTFIKEKQFNDTFKLTKILLNDKHDLIHKACGWMLREVGKKSEQELEKFLKIHYKKMPRTMLRYSIEKFDENKRKKYLNGLI
jgi:3-methyladenine DNA glycosylase AlkD